MNDNRTLVREWRNTVVVDGPLEMLKHQGCVVGISTGFTAALRGRKVYVKPRKSGVAGIAAREKICADLAVDLGVPVPPVVLVDRPCGADEERFCCASLIMHKQQMSWCQLDPATTVWTPKVTEPFLTDLATAGAKAIVFDTWVDQIDHNPSGPNHNIIGGTDDISKPEGELLLLDYQMALGAHGGWGNGGFLPVKMASLPRSLVKRCDRPTIAATLEALERLADNTIRDVVSRVPTQFLSQDEQELIIEGLLARKPLVRGALDSLEGDKA